MGKKLPTPKKAALLTPASAHPDDRRCVAAFNSCIDLDKYKALPDKVKQRIKKLFEMNRVRPVCFFAERGMGLKVYEDVRLIKDKGQSEWNSDEVDVPDNVDVRVAISPHWIRCPKELWEQNLQKKYLVMDARGNKFFEDYDDDVDDVNSAVDWTSQRNEACVYGTVEQAAEVASKVKGIVIEQ